MKHEDDFIKKSEQIPDECLRHCQGHATFSEQNERVCGNFYYFEVNKNILILNPLI